MKRTALLVLPLALTLGLVACGDDDDTSGGADAPAASDDVSESTEAAGTTDDTDAPEGDSDSTWCQLAREVEEQDALFDDIDFTDPEAVRGAFEEATDVLERAVDVAPEDIRGDVETSLEAFAEYQRILEEADFDIMNMDPTAFDEIGAEADAAGDRISEYNERVCGIESDATDATTSDTTEDATAATLPAGSTINDMLVQQFTAMGMTEEQAQCLIDTIDIQEFSESQDVNMLMDAFGECDIDITDLQAGG